MRNRLRKKRPVILRVRARLEACKRQNQRLSEECSDRLSVKLELQRYIKLAHDLRDNWTKAVEQARSEQAALRAEIEKLTKAVTSPEWFTIEATAKARELTAKAPHWAARMLCCSFADSIGDAPNFLTLECGDDEFGHFDVTVQRRHGKSPAQAIDELRSMIAMLRDALNTAGHGTPNALDYLRLIDKADALLYPILNQEPTTNGNA